MNSQDTTLSVSSPSRVERIKSVFKTASYYAHFACLCFLALTTAAIVIWNIVSAIMLFATDMTSAGVTATKVSSLIKSGWGYLALAVVKSLIPAACTFALVYAIKLMKNANSISSRNINSLSKAPAVLHLYSIFTCIDCVFIGFTLFIPFMAYPKNSGLVNVEKLFASLDMSKLYENMGIEKILESVLGVYSNIVTGIFSAIENILNGMGLTSVYENMDLPRIATHLSSIAPILAVVALFVIAYGLLQAFMFASFKKYYYILENVVENENYIADKKAPLVFPIIFTVLHIIAGVFMLINGTWLTALVSFATAAYIITTALFLRKMEKSITVVSAE